MKGPLSLRKFMETGAGQTALLRAHLTCANCWEEISAHADEGSHCLFQPTVFRAATQTELLKREYEIFLKLHHIFYGPQ